MGSGASTPTDETKNGAPKASASASFEPEKQNTEAAPQNADPVNEPSRCPMRRSDGSYSFDFSALWRKDFPHGPGGSKPLKNESPLPAGTQQIPSSSPTEESTNSSQSECPVKNPQSGCPVKHQEYNVYSQPIDPSNQMPSANQLPAPQQAKPLSKDRVVSNIPKGGTDDAKTWTYPSPQMFYNALARKGKLEDTQEDDMENVVAMHNNMNEKTWRKILQWERLAGYDQVKLLKFQGRPTDLSPKATFKCKILGHPLPFDRHDWVVLRDDNTTVRYVIDYYYDESRARDTPESAMPSLHDDDATASLLVDVRPALDGLSQAYHRVVAMPLARHVFQTTPFLPLPMLPTANMKSQVSESVQVWKRIQAAAAANKNDAESCSSQEMTEAQARDLAEKFSAIRSKCVLQEKMLNECQDNCDKASIDWTMCVGPILCSLQHEAFREALKGDSDDVIASTLSTLSDCVAWQSSQHKEAQDRHPKAFAKR